MKNIFAVLIMLQFPLCILYAQNVGIGTTTPDASSKLDVTSTTSGVLVPRMTTLQRNAITSPAAGLLVYDTNTKSFWFYNASAWVNLSTVAAWTLTGNAGSNESTNFIGTPDNKPLRYRVNNVWAGELSPATGNVFFGRHTGQFTTTGYSNVALGADAFPANTTGFNSVAIGDSALFSNTTGRQNTAVGSKTLYSNTIGFGNTAIGLNALTANTQGLNNVAIGSSAMFSNTTGIQNTATGSNALLLNTTGKNNTAQGFFSLLLNTTGSSNTASGFQSLQNNATGYSNVAVGVAALFSNTRQSNLVAVGDSAMYSSTSAFENTAIGSKSLYANTDGYFNTANGALALNQNTSGSENTAIGVEALVSNTVGNTNTATGYHALRYTNSNANTATGVGALENNTSGIGNTAVGIGALQANVSGSRNTALGDEADADAPGLTNATVIGYNARVYASNTVQIGNNNVTDVGFGNYNATLHANNVIAPSDKRFKYNIQHNVPGLAFIIKLQPVTYYFDEEKMEAFTRTGTISNNIFHSASNTARQLRTGFLAQDVEQAASEIGYSFDGVHAPVNNKDHYSLAYSQFIMPLVKAVQEQQAEIEELKKLVQQQSAMMQQQQKMIEKLNK